MHLVAAPDKFKGTATAHEVVEAIAAAAEFLGHTVAKVPMADGGDGTLEALGGANRTSTVTGPLGTPVEAAWRLEQDRAVIEMARASGLVLAGGPEENDPLSATTRGVGELIAEAVDAGATSIVIGVGGSATTDGGLGALEAIGAVQRLRGIDLRVACDVRTSFVDAAAVFGPQKGASPAQVKMLTRRLDVLAQTWADERGVDVRTIERAGAAGGLAGGLATVGATLVDGFDIVAETVGLPAAIEGADLVITGEGFVDAESFDGKVVGGVLRLAEPLGVPVLAVAGQVFDDADERIDTIALADRYGMDRALTDTVACIGEAVADHLSSR